MSSATPKPEPQRLEPEELGFLLRTLVSTATTIRHHEPLSNRTTLRVGGPADVFVEPGTERDLAAVFQFSSTNGVPVFVLGRGSNLLVRDGGIRGIVVHLGTAFAEVQVSETTILCGAGARLKAVALAARDHALAGLEFLEGIPGSVGGALRMNAGAMGSSLFDVVDSVRYMDRAGTVHEAPAAGMRATYRHCAALQNAIALAARVRGTRSSRAEVQARMDGFSRKRWASQPAAPSAGCMFKNPGPIPAGKLIDELGLKGARVGGAAISAEHGNFIVNDNHASAHDVLELIERVRAQVQESRGISLETEVQIAGEE